MRIAVFFRCLLDGAPIVPYTFRTVNAHVANVLSSLALRRVVRGSCACGVFGLRPSPTLAARIGGEPA